MIVSPLRYPGGKAKLFPLFSELTRINGLINSEYCEPYAGGAGLAIRLLTHGYVSRISINDLDASIYAFWYSVLFHTDAFCSLLNEAPVTIEEWFRQKEHWATAACDDYLKLGFAAFFLNRTNRSGIIEGAGPIGGYAQNGPWKLNARLVKANQIRNIQALRKYSSQISVTNKDALDFIAEKLDLPNTLTYLDPPYFVKGRKLYKNFYVQEDHLAIAHELTRKRRATWVVSYDDVPQIRRAYEAFTPVSYSLNYSAGTKCHGAEVIFLSDALTLPPVGGFVIEERARRAA